MTAIELKCVICGKLFWSSGFDHTCYCCACKQEPKVYDNIIMTEKIYDICANEVKLNISLKELLKLKHE